MKPENITMDMDRTMTDQNTEAQADKFKNLGNDQFKLGKFQKAIEFYSQAIGKLGTRSLNALGSFKNRRIKNILRMSLGIF